MDCCNPVIDVIKVSSVKEIFKRSLLDVSQNKDFNKNQTVSTY